MEFKEKEKEIIYKKRGSVDMVDPLKIALRVAQMSIMALMMWLLLSGSLLEITTGMAEKITGALDGVVEESQGEDYFVREEREEKQRDQLIKKEFGVTSKEYIVISVDWEEYEILIDGKYYLVLFDDEYTKIEKAVYKGIDD